MLHGSVRTTWCVRLWGGTDTAVVTGWFVLCLHVVGPFAFLSHSVDTGRAYDKTTGYGTRSVNISTVRDRTLRATFGRDGTRLSSLDPFPSGSVKLL